MRKLMDELCLISLNPCEHARNDQAKENRSVKAERLEALLRYGRR
jgi:hypothetical protein